MLRTKPALLVGQSGGPTAVINASLVGVVEAARDSGRLGAVLGARFGIEGVLEGSLVDLGTLSSSLLTRLRGTPSAALGSCRHKLRPGEAALALEQLRRRDVHYFIYIGGNDSADTALALEAEAQHQGYDLRVVAVPKTVDNDLPETDHCPGYPSAARFIAQSTQDAGLDTEAMRRGDPLKILEVAGRDAGWLAAASTLGRREERSAPHLVCVPERPLVLDDFIAAMERAYRRFGYALAVVAETVRDAQGRPIGGVNAVARADAFAHPAIVGTGAALARAVGEALGRKARYEKPGTLQRMSMALASPVDLEEAYRVGAEAVRLALAGASGVMVGLERLDEPVYRCGTRPVALRRVANHARLLPPEHLGDDPFGVAPAFAAYAAPLIVPPLLDYARL